MAKPVDTPEPWATAGNYPPSVYPATFPWLTPHPEAGNPTPWSGQPRRNATGLARLAAQGAEPLQPQAGDIWNEEFARVVDLCRWLFDGIFAPDQTAHVVETDGTGKACLYSLEVGNPVLFAVSPAAGTIDFFSGNVIVAGGVGSWTQGTPTTFSQQATFNGFSVALNEGADLAAGKAISGPSTTSVNVGVVQPELRIQFGLGGSSTLAGQMYRDGTGALRWRQAAADEYVHKSATGNARATAIQAAATGLAATTFIATTAAIAPLAAGTVAINCDPLRTVVCRVAPFQAIAESRLK